MSIFQLWSQIQKLCVLIYGKSRVWTSLHVSIFVRGIARIMSKIALAQRSNSDEYG